MTDDLATLADEVRWEMRRYDVLPVRAFPSAVPPDVSPPDFDEEEPTIPKPAPLPLARAEAPWWRRLLAWFTASEIETCCARCHSRIEVHADGVCFWCKSLAAHVADWTEVKRMSPGEVDEASRLLTDLRREIVDARRR